jgi:hypothetical protein
MIGDYIIVALVLLMGLSFLGCIHYFWLRDSHERAALDAHTEVSPPGTLSASKTTGDTLRTINALSPSQCSNRERSDRGAGGYPLPVPNHLQKH